LQLDLHESAVSSYSWQGNPKFKSVDLSVQSNGNVSYTEIKTKYKEETKKKKKKIEIQEDQDAVRRDLSLAS